MSNNTEMDQFYMAYQVIKERVGRVLVIADAFRITGNQTLSDKLKDNMESIENQMLFVEEAMQALRAGKR